MFETLNISFDIFISLRIQSYKTFCILFHFLYFVQMNKQNADNKEINRNRSYEFLYCAAGFIINYNPVLYVYKT
jgi:hypothetical protein